MAAKKYLHPKLPASRNSYQAYFAYEWKRRELDRLYTYNVLTKRGNAHLWDLVGDGETVNADRKKQFFEKSVFVQIKHKDTKEVVYFMYISSDFWYISQKDRADHDYIQSVANLHLDKLENAIVRKPKSKD